MNANIRRSSDLILGQVIRAGKIAAIVGDGMQYAEPWLLRPARRTLPHADSLIRRRMVSPTDQMGQTQAATQSRRIRAVPSFCRSVVLANSAECSR